MQPPEKNTEYVPFWAEDPNIMFNQKYIMEFFPTETMTYNQKLNAVSRTIIFLSITSFLFNQNMRILVISGLVLGSIYALFLYHTREESKIRNKISKEKEGFEDAAIAYLNQEQIPIDPNVFMQPTSINPMGNVLMTDYDFNPNKQPAPPSFIEPIASSILNSAKQLVQEANPGQPDIANKLFSDLNDEMGFEQSMRQFVSNPSTTIPNDQGAFADFCYGSMISCKEGNAFACAKNLSHYTNQ
jgi:hypothetical protein